MCHDQMQLPTRGLYVIYSLVEAWRWKNPDTHAFSWLEMCFLSKDILPRVVEVQYILRAISDYSSLILTLAMGPLCGYKLWRLSSLWLKEECLKRSSANAIGNF